MYDGCRIELKLCIAMLRQDSYLKCICRLFYRKGPALSIQADLRVFVPLLKLIMVYFYRVLGTLC